MSVQPKAECAPNPPFGGQPDVAVGARAFYTKPALAAALGVSVRTISRWTALRIGPPVTRIGQRVLFGADAVDRWLHRRESQLVRD